MSRLKIAKDLIKKGFHVFHLVPNSKTPILDSFPEMAATTEAELERWWMDPILEIEQPYNIGISTTKFSSHAALIVVDVDNKGDKHGDDELLKLELQGFELPDTYTQFTPTGGRHLVFSNPTPVKQGVSVLGPGLDIRSKGGYIVAAGSEIDGIKYTANDHPIAPAPKWLVDRCGQAPEKKSNSEAPTPDFTTSMYRAVHYLEKEAPLAVKGEGGDHTTYRVAAKLKDFGVNPEVCLDLMLNHWNDRTTPGWSPERLKEKIEHAYKYGNDPVGIDAPEQVFKPIKEEEAKLSYLQTMNQKYAIIYNEGGHSILEETVDEKGRQKRNFFSELTFKRKFSPHTVQVGKRSLSWAEAWLDWEGRREYQGLCFAPERSPRHGYYNLWAGFAVDSVAPHAATPGARRGLEMFLAHAKENVCQGDALLFRWLMGYFAHLVQKPNERPLTTLVFKGRKGTGKNAIVERFGRILGDRQFLVAHNSRYLTSNFNGHLDSCLMLVLDEAFWSGDKSAEGALKGITTSPEIMIERKGRDPYVVDNLVRIVIIGNEDWLVPASEDERRYAVFQIGEGRMQDRAFFTEMRELMDLKGGNEVLLHYLKNFDLDSMDVNDIPKTQALLEQKMHSLDPFYQWWFECLMDGRIAGAEFQGTWPEQVDKEAFRQAFGRHIRDRQIRSRLPDARTIGRDLKKCLPNAVTDQKRRDGYNTVWVYRFPSLSEARACWEHFIGHKMDWPEIPLDPIVLDALS